MITFLALNVLLVFITGNISKAEAINDSDILQGEKLVYILVSALIAFITVLFFRKLIDRRSMLSLGFKWGDNEQYAATGFFLGLLLLGIGSFILIANKNLHWTDVDFNANQLFLGFGLMVIIAFAEELVFRGYVLNNLLLFMNKWLALSLSALLFALFHANNNGINFIALINVFLAGLMLGINYIYTRNLWFGILFHVSWNFYQGSVLGYRVSGVHLKSVLEQELSGSDLLTGGNFGFEGSLIATILFVISLASLGWIYEKKFVAALLSQEGKMKNG